MRQFKNNDYWCDCNFVFKKVFFLLKEKKSFGKQYFYNMYTTPLYTSKPGYQDTIIYPRRHIKSTVDTWNHKQWGRIGWIRPAQGRGRTQHSDTGDISRMRMEPGAKRFIKWKLLYLLFYSCRHLLKNNE